MLCSPCHILAVNNAASYLITSLYQITLLKFHSFSHASQIAVYWCCCTCETWLCSQNWNFVSCVMWRCVLKNIVRKEQTHQESESVIDPSHGHRPTFWGFFFLDFLWKSEMVHISISSPLSFSLFHSLNLSLCVSLCAGSSRAAWVQTDVPRSLQNHSPSIMLTC